MTIAIDYDKTWTADPDLWNTFTKLAKSRGHQVIIATSRVAPDADGNPEFKTLPVLFCGKEFKEVFCREAGYEVDIWIDDMPGTIQQVVVF